MKRTTLLLTILSIFFGSAVKTTSFNNHFNNHPKPPSLEEKVASDSVSLSIPPPLSSSELCDVFDALTAYADETSFKETLIKKQNLSNSICQPSRDYIPSRAIGAPTYGRLENGVQILSNEYLDVKTRNDYGAFELVETIRAAACTIYEQYKHEETGPRIVVRDLSRKSGGKLKPHRSHRNGLDADVGVYRYEKNTYTNAFKPVNGKLTKETLEINWDFIKALQDGHYQIKYIFLSKRIIYNLRDYVTSTYGKEEWEKYRKVIYYEKGHHNHFHIRIKKPDYEVPLV